MKWSIITVAVKHVKYSIFLRISRKTMQNLMDNFFVSTFTRVSIKYRVRIFSHAGYELVQKLHRRGSEGRILIWTLKPKFYWELNILGI